MYYPKRGTYEPLPVEFWRRRDAWHFFEMGDSQYRWENPNEYVAEATPVASNAVYVRDLPAALKNSPLLRQAEEIAKAERQRSTGNIIVRVADLPKPDRQADAEPLNVNTVAEKVSAAIDARNERQSPRPVPPLSDDEARLFIQNFKPPLRSPIDNSLYFSPEAYLDHLRENGRRIARPSDMPTDVRAVLGPVMRVADVSGPGNAQRKTRARPSRESAAAAIRLLYPDGVPSQIDLPNAKLLRAVGDELKKSGKHPSDETILRAAKRRK